MSALDLDALERALAGRTPGEWAAEDDGDIRDSDGFVIAFVQPHGNVRTVFATGEEYSHADQRAIVAAVNAAPVLIRVARAADAYEHARTASDVALDAWAKRDDEPWTPLLDAWRAAERKAEAAQLALFATVNALRAGRAEGGGER